MVTITQGRNFDWFRLISECYSQRVTNDISKFRLQAKLSLFLPYKSHKTSWATFCFFSLIFGEWSKLLPRYSVGEVDMNCNWLVSLDLRQSVRLFFHKIAWSGSSLRTDFTLKEIDSPHREQNSSNSCPIRNAGLIAVSLPFWDFAATTTKAGRSFFTMVSARSLFLARLSSADVLVKRE